MCIKRETEDKVNISTKQYLFQIHKHTKECSALTNMVCIILVELFCAGNLCQRVRLPLQHLEEKVSQTLQVSPLDVPSLCRHSKKSAVKFMLYYLR